MGYVTSQLEPAAQQLAFEVPVCAEQWEAGLADACSPGSKERKEAARAAAAYRRLRVQRWGLSQYEAALSRGSSVPIEQVLRDGLRDVESSPRPPGHSASSELGSVSDHDDKAKVQTR